MLACPACLTGLLKRSNEVVDNNLFLIFRNIPSPFVCITFNSQQELYMDWKVWAHSSGHSNFGPSFPTLFMGFGTLCYTEFTSKI